MMIPDGAGKVSKLTAFSEEQPGGSRSSVGGDGVVTPSAVAPPKLTPPIPRRAKAVNFSEILTSTSLQLKRRQERERERDLARYRDGTHIYFIA